MFRDIGSQQFRNSSHQAKKEKALLLFFFFSLSTEAAAHQSDKWMIKDLVSAILYPPLVRVPCPLSRPI
jgi:hypothetical protein